jgi:hypothetical protein
VSERIESQVSSPRFIAVQGREREQVVILDWPLEYDGRRIVSIMVRRMNVAQVEAFVEASKANEGVVLPEMFYFPEDGEPVPPEVINALDDDDGAALNKVVDRFLPQRLQRASA